MLDKKDGYGTNLSLTTWDMFYHQRFLLTNLSLKFGIGIDLSFQ